MNRKWSIEDAGIAFGWDFVESKYTPRPPVRSYLCYTLNNGLSMNLTLMGVAHHLALGVWNGTTPIGILYDRLTECPSEVLAGGDDVNEVVEWMRENKPNWTVGP